MNGKKKLLFNLFLVLGCLSTVFAQTNLQNQKIDGYRGIWFELGQKSEYGDKYSGGLGTYTAKHRPLAVYSPEVNKTFFVYGGTTESSQRHLLCMMGSFDHSTNLVTKPTVVFDKEQVNDPHDNPVITIDEQGFLWVFVSGRNTSRLGIKLKSDKPYSIDSFSVISTEEFTYPQVWKTSQGFFHFFTKYTGVRELYFETSSNGMEWTLDQKLAGIRDSPGQKSGHYQLSEYHQEKEIIGTFFNRHINGDPDTRTDLFYIQSNDYGKTWTTIKGELIQLPIEDPGSASKVIDYKVINNNVYLKDMVYDENGFPICLYLTSNGHKPGPANAPYQWKVTHWTGEKWKTSVVGESDHNYDMGSLFLDGKVWQVVAPMETGSDKYATGGEVALFESKNGGASWALKKRMTKNSAFNHSYIRRPLHAKSPFMFFWADGGAVELGPSSLYFGDLNGKVWKLPYTMDSENEKPKRIFKSLF